ncbi:MAG: helix-turn-helix transcriptional regulator [Kiritimatiellae bacterium]|nr:helix-turn-helix transcriptional regulator [Kiritimatiellia bacterium]
MENRAQPMGIEDGVILERDCPPPVLQYVVWTHRKRGKSLHRHTNPGLEITLVLRGRMTIRIEGEDECAWYGGGYFTLPWEVHEGSRALQPPNEVLTLLLALDRPYAEPADEIGFSRGFGFDARETKAFSRAILGAKRHTFRAGPGFATLMHLLFEELRESRPHRDSLVKELAAACLAAFVRSLESTPARSAATQDGYSSFRVKRLIEELNAGYLEDWNLERMLANTGLKRSRLLRTFREITGDSPTVYLNRLRVDHAKGLLSTSDRSVTDIALASGFSSSQYFAGVFKAFTGTTAKGWRRR